MMDLSTIDALVLALGAMVAGIVLLVRGGDWTIDSAVHIAHKFGISPLIVGFTIVAFGTSLPEMVVSVFANLKGSAGIAIGNVEGSNIANILLVIGLTAAFATLKAGGEAVRRDIFMMVGTTFLFVALLHFGSIGRLAGVFMLTLLGGYTFYQYRMSKNEAIEEPEGDGIDEDMPSMKYAGLFLFFGLVCIALGAEFLVRGASISASVMGVPDAVIALTIIALGTSLPELSTCLIAGRKGHGDIVLGNIIGSNVFNILMIMGVTALIKPIEEGSFPERLAGADAVVMTVTALLFAGLVLFRKQISRRAGVVFFGAYIVYNIYIFAVTMT